MVDIFQLFDAGFTMAFMLGNPPIATALLTVAFMIGSPSGSDSQMLFGVFAGALVCAACFKNLGWKRANPIPWDRVAVALILLTFSFHVPFYLIPALLLDFTVFPSARIWLVKAVSSIFFCACVYLSNVPATHQRNVAILATFVIAVAIHLYGRWFTPPQADASAPDTTTPAPATDSHKNN